MSLEANTDISISAADPNRVGLRDICKHPGLHGELNCPRNYGAQNLIDNHK